jgi:NAD(P)-dependent dehydrogenase (short-subunit alcohol dehydrogenase family)
MSGEKVALVTGASRGIGLETARQLVARGWKVAMTARGRSALDTAAATFDSGQVLPVACDAADFAAVQKTVETITERLGAITALVNNAGINTPVGLMHDTDPRAWMQCQEINVGGVLNTCHAVLPGMLRDGRGTIVNLSSGAAHNPVEGWSAYCASKAAVRMFTRSLHMEYGDKGLRIHDFIPGAVATDLLHGAQASYDNVISHLDPDAIIPADLPARCIAWIVDDGQGCLPGEEQSIRDPELRAKVGLEERAKW